jgi:hypothetical protein
VSQAECPKQLASRRPSERRRSAGPILKISMQDLVKDKIDSLSGLITQAQRNGRAGFADRLRDAQTTLIEYLRVEYATPTNLGAGGPVEFIPVIEGKPA